MNTNTVFVALGMFLSMHQLTQAEEINTFYTKLNINNQQADEGNGPFTETRSNNSWIGIKGSIPLDDEFSAFYKLEYRVNITGESEEDTLTERPQFVGLRSRFGEIALGRDFTALWKAQGKIDLFNHYEGDIAAIWEGENRLSDTTTYTSPSYHHVKAIVTYQAEKDTESDSATSVGVYYGDPLLHDTSIFAALAHDFDVEGYDVTRASAQIKLGHDKLGIMLQEQEATDPLNGERSETGALISYKHPFGHWDLLGQYQVLENDNTVNLGMDYRFNPHTMVYTWYANVDQESSNERSYYAIGIEHKFSKTF